MSSAKRMDTLTKKVAERYASSPEQWELGGEILDKGLDHPAFFAIEKSWTEVGDALNEAQKASQALKRVGVGRTEDATLIEAKVIPALKDHIDVIETVVRQLKQKLGL